MKISQLVQWAELKWHKLHQPSSNISGLSKGKDPVEDTVPSPILSHFLQKGRTAWFMATEDYKTPGIKFSWTEPLQSAPCSSWAPRALLLSLRKASTGNCFHLIFFLQKFIFTKTSPIFVSLFPLPTFHRGNLHPNSFTLIQFLHSN